MAISKIKPIKKTLKKAIDYITAAEKTESGKLVSSFCCSPVTADIEMQMTADKAKNESERLAYHLIQSFSPEDDITPEKAHELGKQFADRLLEGKYEYVIATHVDKGHIHNHIIFNATSFVDYKKYHMPYWHKYHMFNINDQICRENHLSVIENNSGRKGKSLYEYKASKSEKDEKSWIEKLRSALDSAIRAASTYEEFINIMEMEGYEYKETEKNLSFCAGADGQKRFTRVNERNFGEYYTKEMLLKRIHDKEFDQSIGQIEIQKEKPQEKKKEFGKKAFSENKINLIVDISKNIKAQQSGGYEHALVMANINTMVKTMNYLQQNGMTTLEDLSDKAAETVSLCQDMEGCMAELEKERKLLSQKIKYSQNYVKYRKTARQAKKEPVGSEFLKNNKNEILLFQVASLYMEKNKIDTSYLDIKKMIEEHKELLKKKKMIQPELKKMREKVKELETVRKNVEQILDTKIEVKEKKEKAKKELEKQDVEK